MKTLLAAITIVSLALNSYLAFQLWLSRSKTEIKHSDESIVVMRTRGGLLEVSMITSEERFDSTTNHTILGMPVGQTVAQIRVPATYRYHIPLAKDWTLRSTDDTLIVVAPPVRPSLPVAIDTSKLQSFSSGIWSPMAGPGAIASLQQSITASLGAKAGTTQLFELQRETARKTVSEFVQKWVVEQARWKGAKVPVVLVFFADEPLGIKAAPLFP